MASESEVPTPARICANPSEASWVAGVLVDRTAMPGPAVLVLADDSGRFHARYPSGRTFVIEGVTELADLHEHPSFTEALEANLRANPFDAAGNPRSAFAFSRIDWAAGSNEEIAHMLEERVRRTPDPRQARALADHASRYRMRASGGAAPAGSPKA